MPPELFESSSLLQYLDAVPDYRCAQGRRYPLWIMLLMTVLGVMSGCQSYRALEDFGIRHYQRLCEMLGLSLRRMPSDSTLRRMFHRIDFAQLTEQFNAWAQAQFAPQPGDWLSADGKSLKGTVTNEWEAFQDFVSVVSLYSHRHRLVIAQQGYQNKQSSEIHVLQQLLEQLGIQGVTLTLDALHCQKNGTATG